MRHYGVLGNRDRAKRLMMCRTVLRVEAPPPTAALSTPALMHRLTGIDIEQCPYCRQGRLRGIATVYRPRAPAGQMPTTGPPLGLARPWSVTSPAPRARGSMEEDTCVRSPNDVRRASLARVDRRSLERSQSLLVGRCLPHCLALADLVHR